MADYIVTQEPPSRRLRRASFAVAVFASVLVPVLADAGVACATEHSRPYVTGFFGASSVPLGYQLGSRFYAAAETGPSVQARITVTGAHQCAGTIDPGWAYYLTEDGTAVSPADYAGVNPRQPSNQLCVNLHPDIGDFCEGKPPFQDIAISIEQDATQEAAVEAFLFKLERGNFPLNTFHPTQAPVYIIDDDGPARVSLEPTLDGAGAVAYEKDEFGGIMIPVFWAGPGPPGGVSYTVGPPPAGPAATEGVDYVIESPNPLPVGPGRVAFIRIRIVGDTLTEEDESVSIRLEGGPGYAVAEPSTTTFTILDNDHDRIAPVTRFHHPRQAKKYRRGDYRIREFHTFYRDEGGAGIATAHVALRRKMKSGKCQWWHGSRFRPGKCGAKVWKNMKYEPSLDWFYARFPALRPTVGTTIRNYRAWTRGVDRAGNVERSYQRGRNLSTFWVRKD